MLAEIKKLIDNYVKCWMKGESGIKIDSKNNYVAINTTPCESRYLIIRHYNIHDIPLEVLRELPVLLIKTHKVQNVNHDHKYLWAWTIQLVNELKDELAFLKQDVELLNQMNLVFRVNLLSITQITSIFPELSDVFAKDFIISAHLAFPLLERMLKIMCEDHVDVDGTIRKQFEVPLGNRVIKYGKDRKRVNRVGHLLYLFYKEYASTNLKKHLEEFCNLCREVYGVDKGACMFKFIDEWRNTLIHGEKFWPTMNAAIINLVTLILLHEVPYDKYFRARERILRNIQFWSSEGIRTPWVFYPPKL